MPKRKLVRDNMPERIEAHDGKKPNTYVADHPEYMARLRDKLFEEVGEFLEKPCAEEAGDVLQAVEDFCRLHRITQREVQKEKSKKAKTHGRFRKRIIWIDRRAD